VGYQAAHHLSPTGWVDQETWQALNSDTDAALTAYTISPHDVQGPFERIPHDLMAQAKLKHLGYQSPAEGFGERFHIDPVLLRKLNPRRSLQRAAQTIFVPNVARDYAPSADRVVVSRTHRTVSALAPDGTVLAQYPATIGSEHDPLPIGDWKVTVIQQNPVFNFNPDFFGDAKPRDSKALIAAGPNNPVGVVWIGLSKEHYGIHGTPEPGLIGHVESHGCIRLTNWDAEKLSKMLKVGVPAILQEE
jgi:lipoprotein-anchoring transpeptidase ErfK/SrfK